jgi:hypothetical protein
MSRKQATRKLLHLEQGQYLGAFYRTPNDHIVTSDFQKFTHALLFDVN